MAGVSVDGGGHGGKKSLDSEIPLVPFIDLLLCCVMFLLATAVWNQLARINANQQTPGKVQDEQIEQKDEIKLFVQVTQNGYTISSTAGEKIDIPKNGDDYDSAELQKKLKERKQNEPNRTKITVAPEDGVLYKDIVTAMDLVVGEGFTDMSLRDGASLM